MNLKELITALLETTTDNELLELIYKILLAECSE